MYSVAEENLKLVILMFLGVFTIFNIPLVMFGCPAPVFEKYINKHNKNEEMILSAFLNFENIFFSQVTVNELMCSS